MSSKGIRRGLYERSIGEKVTLPVGIFKEIPTISAVKKMPGVVSGPHPQAVNWNFIKPLAETRGSFG